MVERKKKIERKERISFEKKYGYELDNETDSQKFKRLGENRIAKFNKAVKALEYLARYKYTDAQKLYVLDAVEAGVKKINEAWTKTEKTTQEIKIPD